MFEPLKSIFSILEDCISAASRYAFFMLHPVQSIWPRLALYKIALSNWKVIKKVVLIQESQQQTTSTVTTKADEARVVTDNITPDQGLIKINKTVSVSYKLW